VVTKRGIAVIGPPEDPQASRVVAALRRRGMPVLCIDAVAFPGSLRMSLGPALGPALDTKFGNRRWRMGRDAPLPPRAAYLRSLGGNPLSPGLSGELQARPRGVVAQCAEKRAFLRGWLAQLESEGCLLVNSPEANDQHAEKPRQLGLLDRAGLPVPPWLATNDPGAVYAFASEAPLVYKPLAGGAAVHPVTPADLEPERLEALALAPVLFQRRVDGLALRVYVVNGDAVGAVAIHSDALDYRGHETAIETAVLEDAEADIAIRAAAACGMPFSGVDLIREPGGRVWLLECNPSPMFAAIEDATGVQIAEPLAHFLVETAEKAEAG
jgi:hypothetical protein